MKKTLLRLGLLFINLVLIGAVLFMLAPWKSLVADRIAQALETNGLPNARLSLAAIGSNQARIENLTFGDPQDPLKIETVTANYEFEQVQAGRMKTLTLSGLDLRLERVEQGWTLKGWPMAEDQTTLIPPVTEQYKNAVPADHIRLENANLTAIAPGWTLTLPLAATWQKDAKPDFAFDPAQLTFEGEGVKVAGTLEASAALNAEKKKWEGAWSLKSMTIHQQGAQEDIPPAELSGTIEADEKTLTVLGKIKGDSKAYDGAFRYTYPFAAPDKAALTLSDLSMPWQDGTLSTKDVSIPLAGSKPYTLNLKISKASVSRLMQEFTGETVKATGTISGAFPLTIGQDGKITIGKGTLTADAPGQLSMPPESIPGEGAQMQLTRDILAQFDYKLLSLTTEQEEKGGLAIKLRIEGNNPKVEEGRPVILNIRLTGDLLDFITSSAIVFTSPQTLIRQGNK
ncbi:MAG: YdbH domain-containing protein [Alphaproteobacteria bacterium]|nr:YdbH domain-containing protein [Alphaproteobacteria bacterium]